MEKEKKSKTTEKNSIQDLKAVDLFNSIIAFSHKEEKEKNNQTQIKKHNFLANPRLFSVLMPFKSLWYLYKKLSLIVGFLFLTVFIFAYFIRPLMFSHNQLQPQSTHIIKNTVKPAYLSQSEVSLKLLDIISQQESPEVLATTQGLNDLLNIIRPGKGVSTFNATKLDYEYIGKNSLVFSLKTQNGVNSPVIKPTYTIDFQPQQTVIQQSSSRLEYTLLQYAVANKLTGIAKQDFSKSNSFMLGSAKVQLQFQATSEYNPRGTMILTINASHSGLK